MVVRGEAKIKFNQKNEGCADLVKAKDLGSAEAEKKLKQYCN